jgi:hypothetical protein
VPVSYQYDETMKMVRTCATGPLNLPEVLAHFAELAQDPRLPPRVKVFLDLRGVTSLPESDQLRAVVSQIERVRPAVTFDACAVLVGTDAMFGMMRMFQTFADGLFSASRTFRDADDAEDWLAAQPDDGTGANHPAQ